MSNLRFLHQQARSLREKEKIDTKRPESTGCHRMPSYDTGNRKGQQRTAKNSKIQQNTRESHRHKQPVRSLRRAKLSGRPGSKAQAVDTASNARRLKRKYDTNISDTDGNKTGNNATCYGKGPVEVRCYNWDASEAFRKRSGNVQETFRKRSGNVQETSET